MKNKIITIIITVFLLGCEEPDNVINDILESVQQGAVLRTISSEGEYNYYAPDDSVFELTFEEHDILDGKLMQNVEVYLSQNEGSESLYMTLSPNDFTLGPTGLPRASLSISLKQAIENIGSGGVEGGDEITIRLKLNLTDGRSFSSGDVTGSLTGSYFASPYEYIQVVKCIPLNAVPGLYTLLLADSFDDGWQGSQLKVTIDGEIKYYGIPGAYNSDAEGNAILEPIDGGESKGKVTFTIPEGAKTMSFEWISGAYPEECSYEITYSNLDGSNLQSALSESNPSEGKKLLSICQ